MNGLSILMTIFGISLLLFGLYIYTGHDVSKLFIRAQFKNLNKSEWKNIGKWTMIVSIIPFVIALIACIFNIK